METINPKKIRSGKTTYQQYTIYLDELELNDPLRTNKYSPEDPNVLETSWMNLTNKLNCSGGPKRTTAAWKKVFADWKCAVKKRARNVSIHQNGTGGGPPEKPLTDLEEKLINIIGKVVVTGFPDIPEIGLNPIIVDNETENTQLQEDNCPSTSNSSISQVEIQTTEIKMPLSRKRKLVGEPIGCSKKKMGGSRRTSTLTGTIASINDEIKNRNNCESFTNTKLAEINANLEKLVDIEERRLQLETLKFNIKYPGYNI